MSQAAHREVGHEITVQAAAMDVYQIIADVTNWPHIFPPNVHVEYLERSDTQERIQIWATANEEAKTWISRRDLDPTALRVDFRQERSTPPVGAMGGTWLVESLSVQESKVRLLHNYRAVDDDPSKLEWINKAVDRNSQSELAALKASAELMSSSAAGLLTFDDSMRIASSCKHVYDFINEARLWEERLPHVARVRLDEDPPGLQLLEMDTRTSDGSVHTTKSVRVCLPPMKIAYKQIKVPPLMSLHTGQWLLEETSSGVTATSRHTVVINEDNVTSVLGDGSGLEDAQAFVRKVLGMNSRTTLEHAKNYAERLT